MLLYIKNVFMVNRCLYTDLWGRLPRSWQDVLSWADFNELGSWLDYNEIVPRCQRPWPLSLLALRAVVLSVSLPRKTTRSSPSEANGITMTSNSVSLESVGSTELGDDLHSPASPECRTRGKKGGICHGPMPHGPKGEGLDEGKLHRAFQKHVTPKKRHEIFKMAEVVCQLAMDANVDRIVDIGSGIGHLARLLSYGHGLSVCCIEAQETLTCRARKLDKDIEKTLSKMLTEEELKLLPQPSHVTTTIGHGLEWPDFVQLVSQAFWPAKSLHLGSVDDGFGIVGLHPCGDLAPYLMQIFVDCPEARFICIAGCCYMKLTPGIGFPMSVKAASDAASPWQRDFQLSYEAREMACHAIESYSRNLLSGDASSLKIHCYRAALENIIAKNWPSLRRRGLKSIKYNEHLQFSEYASRALSALNLIPPEKDVISEETIECLNCWRQVVCFYSLRLMLAPLVETLVLLDRFLFLSLKGTTCRISPEFDPELSPRNHLLIASKPVFVSEAALL